MDMPKERFQIIFEGDAVEYGVIDVADFAPALFAFGQLCQEANKTLNGSRAKVNVYVRADFEKGSFGVDLDLAMTIFEQTKALFLSTDVQSARDILETIGVFVGLPTGASISLFHLMKWLKGKNPEQVEQQKDGSFNISVKGDNNVINVPAGVGHLYNNRDVRKSLEKFSEPINKEGFNRVGFKEGDEIVSEITREEAPYFATYHLESDGDEFESTQSGLFEVVQLSFSTDLKWRLSDGTTRFPVKMDEDFIEEIGKQEAGFFKGDMLECDILTKSWKTDQGLKSVKIVTKVHKVHRQPRQTVWTEENEDD